MAAKNNPSGFSAVLHCTICATLIKPTHIISKVQGPDKTTMAAKFMDTIHKSQ
jgi:hypothetical protein